MPQPVNIQVGGNVDGNIVVGDNNLVVNTNHGTIIYKESAPRVRARDFAPQPPRAPRGFINRSAELQKLEGWIAANEIVLLHGPDGMGKSALLKQAANSAAARAMPAGVIPLEPLDADGLMSGLDDLIQKLFDALFESKPRLKVTASTARTYLSNTRPLILLDEVPLPQPLQMALPDLFPQGAILLAADVSGASDFQRIQVGPLPRAEALTLLSGRSGLALTDENRAAFNSICAALGDVPLALVVTANALRETGISLADTLAKLSAAATGDPGQFETLTGATITQLAQAALDRAYGFVYGLLKPEEQKILASAALTPGLSMTPEWLGSVLGGQDASVFIERLKALELLFANSPRLRLQPGFRQSAQKSARSLISENTLYTRLIDYLGRGLADPAFLAAELGNLLGAIAWAARHADWQAVIRLGRGVDAYLTLNGLWDAWNAVLGLLRETAAASGDSLLRGWVLHQLGTRLLALGDKPGAETLLREALNLRLKIGDNTGAAYTQHNLNLLLPPPAAPNPAPKPPARFWPILGVAGLIAIGLTVLVGAILLFNPGPTPTATFTPSPKPQQTARPTRTPRPGPSDTPTPVPTLTASPTPTPPGGSGLLAFQSMPANIRRKDFILYSLQIDVNAPRQVLSDYLPASQPAWSPDGQTLAFTAIDNTTGLSQIFLVSADGSNLRQFTSIYGNNSHPTWSPDGQQIAFLHNYIDSGSDIYIVDANGGLINSDSPYTNLTQSDATGIYDYPEWSPDGSRLAFQGFVDNNWELFLINADGSSRPEQITRAANQENDWSIQPSWSPDSQMLAFASNRSGNWDLYILNLPGGDVKDLTRDDFYDIQPDWSPDGQLLAFSSNRDGIQQIYLITIDGAVIRPVTKLPGQSQEPDWLPVSP